ncbi:MAG TPA: hypothetical protein VK590_00405 [Saprospiraceae bacterium]|nr:hypothetical protein [Saprospiraceae bacterium]
MTNHKKELRTMLEMIKKAGENEIDKISVRTVLDTLISLTKRVEELESEDESEEEVGILERLKMVRVTALANKLVDILRTEQQSIGQCTLTMLLVDSSIRNDISKAEFLDAMNSFWDGRVKELEEDNQDGDEDE